MTGKVLILGYGRAGKRQAKLAAHFGLDVVVYDPFLPAGAIEKDGFLRIPGIGETLKSEDDFREDLHLIAGNISGFYVVVCTPPKDHLWQIEACLDAGAKAILCEKPLCDIGQLERAKALPQDAPVMVAYNYRYHPKLVRVKGSIKSFRFMICQQYRPELPEWGLLLDHCSHDLDIVRMIIGRDVSILVAEKDEYTNTDSVKDKIENQISWTIKTSWGYIFEGVSDYPNQKRRATIELKNQPWIEIDPDPTMFTDMWQAFLAGHYYPDLAEAIKTQELLEDCYRLNEVQNDNC